MSAALLDDDALPHVRRRVRLVGILAAAEDTGLVPLPARQLHAIAYFADALAPVWDLRILDGQVLKLREGPNSPKLQEDLDRLVGMGVVIASAVTHVEDEDGLWRLNANFSLNMEFAQPILAKARTFERFTVELDFLREVVFALSGLGAMGIATAGASDATYGDEMIAPEGVVDLVGEAELNPTARVAIRFGELLEPDITLSNAEMVHLYVRELYNRVRRDD